MTTITFQKTKYYAVIGNRGHIKYQGEKRPFWEFLDSQPDGYLISLAYLPIPFPLPNTPKIGDCGAWSYKAEILPKLGKNLVTPEWVISQYQLYFSPDDLVIAPDHMLIPLPGIDLDEPKMRFEGIDTRYYGSNESNMGRAAHNLNMLMLAHNHVSKTPEITLVSCVGQKLNKLSQARSALPSRRESLYQSPWFIKCKSYVESQNYNWFILSTKYGLIKPETIIEPYEKTLNNTPAVQRRQWSQQVFASIVEILPKGGTVRFFAGEKYRQYLIPLLEEAGYKSEVPLQGLGIGQQLQWFDNNGADESNYISIDEENVELNPDKLSPNLLLNFPSLRDKCLQHIQEAHQRCHCGQKFRNPDFDWLKAEFSNIFDSLESDDAIYDYNDLVNAFYSVVFELEYGQKLYPNTLIKYGNDIYRIIAFYDKYPIRVKMLRYKKHSNGQLAKYQSRTYLHRPVQRILLIDPLSKITY